MGNQSADECGRSTAYNCRRRVKMAQTGIVSNVLFVASLACLLQVALGDGKTLVLLDNPNLKDTHSIFFRSLAGEYQCLRIHLAFIMSEKQCSGQSTLSYLVQFSTFILLKL